MRRVINDVRIETSERYNYLYFYFPSGRVVGIPTTDSNASADTLAEGLDSLVDVVRVCADDELDEMP